ncbi:hypothetical protein E4Z66_17090 [Aliishimia ponticola]|uniref:Translocase n=1 Tax=Aliishimia ponticola TaxID=2499833 RepID=A0A4S4N9D0_9RHOB|nr:hypothetical protein [Aliishimia ponticola]THH34688.1 hypothetical protein E4Z66_17090 [Aliishimia ponticola]
MTAVGTLACALGIGFVMQSSEISKHRYGSESEDDSRPAEQIDAGADQHEEVELGEAVQVQNITFTSAFSVPAMVVPTAEQAQPLVERHAGLLDAPRQRLDQVPIAESGCGSVVVASPEPGAFVKLTIMARCAPNARATIHHDALIFTQSVDENGKLEVLVPALSSTANFNIELADGEDLTTLVTVPDMEDVRRVVLQYSAGDGFELHAREFGAEYGAEGHVWRGSGSSPEDFKAGKGGYLTVLGARDLEDAHIAEVYSYPAALSARNGQIDLSVEARITEANCGRQVQAQSLELKADGHVSNRSISLNVPGCDAEGDYLMLNNLFEDLKIAAR